MAAVSIRKRMDLCLQMKIELLETQTFPRSRSVRCKDVALAL